VQPAPPITVFSVSLEAWLTIVAIIIGPLAALLIQKYIENRRAQQDRKIAIFRNIMAHRASRLSAPYVQALNGIETEFYGDTKVINAWRTFVDHLYAQDEKTDPTLARWSERNAELLTNLLLRMAESLGYRFEDVAIKRNAYAPKGWDTIETEQTKLRQSAIKVFEGQKPLKVEITNAAEPPQGTNQQ
jgi:hypothetical protein